MTFDELFCGHTLTAAERAALVRFLALSRFERTIAALAPTPLARGIDGPEGVETLRGSTAKPQEPGPEGAPETQGQPIKSGETP